MHLHIAVVKILWKTFDGHVIDVVSVVSYFRLVQELYQRSLKLAMAALASVRAGCMELIAGQF